MDTTNNSKSFQTLKNVLYPCAMTSCGRLFARRSDLHHHQLIHREEHPFKCSERNCGKTFKREGHLVRHQRIHSDEKPFYCKWDGCGENFREKRHLVEHQRNHSGENPFRCDWDGCDKSFTRSPNRNRHRRDIHGSDRQLALLHLPQKILWKTASTFDSDVFDDMIRRQTGALPSTVDQQSGSLKLSDRSGRKTWFGEVAERLVWLRDKQAQIETQSHLFGRIASFVSVEEKDLPLYVKANPAWVDACARCREEKEFDRELQDMQRRVIRDVQRRQQAKGTRTSETNTT